MSPENLMMGAADYNRYQSCFASSSSNDIHHGRDIHYYGSADHVASAGFQCAAATISEAASITLQELQRSCTRHGSGEDHDIYASEVDACSVIEAKIASHPSYPKLLDAYIDCQKVGAPPEIAGFLDEMRRENGSFCKGDAYNYSSTCLGSDPELDEFMETYYDILVKYKSDLARPFDEAATFLSKIEMQLGNLCRPDIFIF